MSQVRRLWLWGRICFLRNVPVYGVDGRWRGTGQPCAGVVVPDGLDNASDDCTEHADDTSCRDGGKSPLDYGKRGVES